MKETISNYPNLVNYILKGLLIVHKEQSTTFHGMKKLRTPCDILIRLTNALKIKKT